MKQDGWPISESPFAHLAWPENHSVGLVLDGVAIPGLGEQIYQWAGDQPFSAECLYVTTRWEVMSDMSPWLVWLRSRVFSWFQALTARLAPAGCGLACR